MTAADSPSAISVFRIKLTFAFSLSLAVMSALNSNGDGVGDDLIGVGKTLTWPFLRMELEGK
jgi:hypothetical protein